MPIAPRTPNSPRTHRCTPHSKQPSNTPLHPALQPSNTPSHPALQTALPHTYSKPPASALPRADLTFFLLQFAEEFQANDVDGEALAVLDAEALAELGITTPERQADIIGKV